MLSLSQAAGYGIQDLSCLDETGSSVDPGQGRRRADRCPEPLSDANPSRPRQGRDSLHQARLQGRIPTYPTGKENIILEVVKAVNGEDCVGDCLLGRAVCSDLRACSTHEFWKLGKIRIEKCLAGISLADVAAFERKRAKSSKKKPGRIGWLQAKPKAG